MSWLLFLGLGFALGMIVTLGIGALVHYIVTSIKDHIDESVGELHD